MATKEGEIVLWLTFELEAPIYGPMKLLIVILKDYSKIEELLLAFLELEVTGTTVLEGQGMGQIIGDVPIFAGLRGLFPGSAHNSYVMLSVVTEAQVDPCIGTIEDLCGPLGQPSTGIVFTVPIGDVRGIKETIR